MARRRPAPPSVPGKKPRRNRVLLALAALLVAVVLVAFYRPLLGAAGYLLVAEDSLEKCDAAVVLSGEQGDGLRTREAVRLYQKGWVKKIVLSGTYFGFGYHETDFSLPLAVRLGVPREDLLPILHEGRSTLEEARIVVPVMEKAGIRTVVIVTSNFHTRRARRIFRRVAVGRLRVLVHPATDQWFQPDSWWRSREGLKIFFYEATKNLAALVE